MQGGYEREEMAGPRGLKHKEGKREAQKLMRKRRKKRKRSPCQGIEEES